MNAPRIQSIVKQHANREVARLITAMDLDGAINAEKVVTEAWDRYVKSVLELDNHGWSKIGGSPFASSGISLEDRKVLSERCHEATAKSPLLKRGRNVRFNNAFGEGVLIKNGESLQPRFRRVINDPVNQEQIFNEEAQRELDGALFNSGTMFAVWHKPGSERNGGEFERIGLSEIVSTFHRPGRPNQVTHYLRQTQGTVINATTGAVEPFEIKEWLPVDTYIGKVDVDRIDGIPVNNNAILIDVSVNRESDNTRLGLPDVLPVLPWDFAYQEGMRDGIKLIKALATIAWLVKQRSAKGAANVGAKVATKGRGAGQTAVATEGTELTSLPRSNAVDLTQLRPIASMVATGLEVSTVAIISDSGAASGSNAAETTLDGPSVKSALSRQRLFQSFYRRCFRAMGIPEASIPEMDFPQLSSDPAHRRAQSLTLAYRNNGIHQDEYRSSIMETLDVIPLHDDPPEITPAATAQAPTDGPGSPTGVGPLADDNELRDNDL